MIDQIASTTNALSRSQAATPSFLDAAAPAGESGDSSQGDFSSMISQMIANTAEALHRAEGASIAGIQGKASVQNVVEAVLGAEQSLQAAIAIRDKVTAAYLELSRMSI
jgi:flagellar hook-basal body complex protein FliE